MYCTDDAEERRFEVTVTVDDVGFPLQNAMFAGQTSLNPAAACYVRYKFYDRSTRLVLFLYFVLLSVMYIACNSYI